MTDVPYVIRVLAHANGTPVNAWLQEYDSNGFDGAGRVVFTADVHQARVFPSFQTAMDCWKQPSTIVPVRLDGKPNRPLTAFTVMPMKQSDAVALTHGR